MEAGKGGGDGFEFGFNDAKFSDRILRIEILPDPPKPQSGNRICGEECLLQSILVNNYWLFTLFSPSSNRLFEGDETDQNHDEGPSSNSAHPTVLRVKTVHISSIILAQRSPFFYKMFSNGMIESEQEKVTLQIYASDKYEITPCIKACGLLLQKIPLNCELALSYVDLLPSSVIEVEGVSQLVAEAKRFLAKVSKNITIYHEEAMKLNLDRVKVALSGDELKVASEDEVFDFVLKWVAAHFPNSNDRQEILMSQLRHCIRFPHLSCEKLREVLTCKDLDPKISSEIVLEALFFKAGRLNQKRSLMEAKLNPSLGFSYVERAYNLHPLKVIEFDSPLVQSIVHLDLTREDVTQMNRIRSQDFYVGGNQFHLKVSKSKSLDKISFGQSESLDYFGIYLCREAKNQLEVCPVTVQYEFAVRQTNGKFTTKKDGKCTFDGPNSCEGFKFLGNSWNFINDVMYLRADVVVEKVHASPLKGADPAPRQQRSGR